jgi:cell wall-active antibiotic response 4TMS protein YvqF
MRAFRASRAKNLPERTILAMASNPPPPTTPIGPPAQPGPGASRDEWRTWRHQTHDYWRAQRSTGGWYGPWGGYGPWGWWGSGSFWPLALVVIGVYFLLQNVGLLNWLPGDVLWPSLLILFGIWLLVRRTRWWP